jgi:hypothetical protein
MARHHFVPQFLLRNWATQQGKLVGYHFEPGANRVIENPDALVTSACQIRNLNTYFGVASQSDFPEVGFFTPRVDTPAANALQVMLTNAVHALTPAQRVDWARLLVSFGVRTPETLRKMGPTETRRAFKLVEGSTTGPPDDERKVTMLIGRSMPKFMRNFPLNAAMDICTDPGKLAKLVHMQWWIRRWPRPTILIGDRPLLTYPRAPYPCGIPLENRSLLVVLPIAPNAVFFASVTKTRHKMRTMVRRLPWGRFRGKSHYGAARTGTREVVALGFNPANQGVVVLSPGPHICRQRISTWPSQMAAIGGLAASRDGRGLTIALHLTVFNRPASRVTICGGQRRYSVSLHTGDLGVTDLGIADLGQEVFFEPNRRLGRHSAGRR